MEIEVEHPAAPSVRATSVGPAGHTTDPQDTPVERARCCELAAREFDALGDPVHAAECRQREWAIPKQWAPSLLVAAERQPDDAA